MQPQHPGTGTLRATGETVLAEPWELQRWGTPSQTQSPVPGGPRAHWWRNIPWEDIEEPSFLLQFGSAEQPVTVQQLWPGSTELIIFPYNQMLPSLILSEHLSNCGSFCETSVEEETKGSRDAVEMKALLYISNALTDFSFLPFFLAFLIKALNRPFL